MNRIPNDAPAVNPATDPATSCPKCGEPWGEPHKSNCGQSRRRAKKYKAPRCEQIVWDHNGDQHPCGLDAVAIHKQVFTEETRFLCEYHAQRCPNDGAIHVVGYLVKAFDKTT